MAIVSTICFALLSSITFTRVQRFRDREAGVVTDFLTHYVEHLKALPFEQVAPGRPLNTLYDGKGGGLRILLPASGTWSSLADTNYLMFHPDLVWMSQRQPQLRMTLATTAQGGVPQAKHVMLELRWAQPLSTRMLTHRLDLVRVKDL